MDQSLLTEARLRALVPERIFQRGEAYCRRGAVLELARRGDVLHASVEGSGEFPYRVRVTTRGDRIIAHCDCPYVDEWGEWCKHIVAVMLAVVRHRGEIVVQPTVQALVQPLDRASLEQLVESLVELDSRLYDVLRATLESPVLQAGTHARASVRRDVPERTSPASSPAPRSWPRR